MQQQIESGLVLYAIVGPTGIGKTALAIELAKKLNTEIISFDSRQFYSEMRIGTAVPSDEELAQVPHHFIQDRSITTLFTVGDYEKEALHRIEELQKKYAKLVLVGGSGLYLQAITHGFDEFPAISQEVRDRARKSYENHGLTYLQDELAKLDPAYYAEVDIHNPQRILRALEVCYQSGKPYSSFKGNAQLTNKRPFQVVYIGLDGPREALYERINQRVDVMMQAGLLQEVERLQSHRTHNALQTVGYSELFAYLDGEYDLDRAVELIKQNSRRYAKRQLTWFKRKEETHWFDFREGAELITQKIVKLPCQ